MTVHQVTIPYSEDLLLSLKSTPESFEAEARLLNAPFIKFAATGKCWVILKWAQTIDGKLDYAHTSHESRITNHESGWITNEKSRKDEC